MKKLSNIVNDVVEDYIRHTLKDADGLLKELEVFAEENSVPIAVSYTHLWYNVLRFKKLRRLKK